VTYMCKQYSFENYRPLGKDGHANRVNSGFCR